MTKLDQPLTETSDVRNLPQDQRRALALDAANALPTEEKQSLVREIGQPDQRIIDWIWLIVVVAIALVLVGSAGAMIYVFAQTGKLDAGAMLTVFTTVMGFFAGLLVKSPIAK